MRPKTQVQFFRVYYLVISVFNENFFHKIHYTGHSQDLFPKFPAIL